MHLRSLILAFLASAARRRLSSETTVIGITGSVGKTTTKDAARKILATKYATHANEKSFNSEFGVPLTILDEQSGYTSASAWLGIVARSFFKQYTTLSIEKLILELGVDKPGDMDDLLRLVQPTIGVVTAIAPVHLSTGQFATIDAIAAEKSKLVASLPTTGIAIVNADDALVASMTTSATRLTFGIAQPADLTATDIRHTADGLTAAIRYHGEEVALTAPIVGTHNLYPLLAAIAIGLASDMPLTACVAALADFHLPAGRGNLIDGVNGSYLIDGSYNANVASMKAMLDTLAELPTTGRRIAILGQMNELGTLSRELHESLGKYASERADEVIGVYGDARHVVETVTARGGNARFFETADEAGDYLVEQLRPGDVALIKGSQNNVRLEKCVKRVMAHPERASDLLCRQETFWLKS